MRFESNIQGLSGATTPRHARLFELIAQSRHQFVQGASARVDISPIDARQLIDAAHTSLGVERPDRALSRRMRG